MMTAENKYDLTDDITKAVNTQIKNGASRVEICAIFAQESLEILEGLAWLPLHLQEAKKAFELAKLHLMQ